MLRLAEEQRTVIFALRVVLVLIRADHLPLRLAVRGRRVRPAALIVTRVQPRAVPEIVRRRPLRLALSVTRGRRLTTGSLVPLLPDDGGRGCVDGGVYGGM